MDREREGYDLGPSGIGFVNFGKINDLVVEEPTETLGPGAREFNVYTGTVKRADFARVVTHGDGAVGVQISQPIGDLTVRRGIETFGATGPSLVKGVVQNLLAIALSIKPGGSAKSVIVEGGLKAHGRMTRLQAQDTDSGLTAQISLRFPTPEVFCRVDFSQPA